MKTYKQVDNIVIHNYPSESFMKVIVNFRTGNKAVITSVFKDLKTAFDYMNRNQFCHGIRYRVISHKKGM